jgi:5'-nucleotidase
MKILVDQDDTILLWGKQKDRVLRTNHPTLKNFRFGNLQTTWDMMEGLDEEHKAAMVLEMNRPGFYRTFEPIPGAVRALREMVEAGHDVFIVSTPWSSNPTCMQDKFDWLNSHVGHYDEKNRWGDRLILTRDKTMIKGDILIDDKPAITGAAIPEWEHVLFTQPHNKSVTNKRRFSDWSKWREIIGSPPPVGYPIVNSILR